MGYNKTITSWIIAIATIIITSFTVFIAVILNSQYKLDKEKLNEYGTLTLGTMDFSKREIENLSEVKSHSNNKYTTYYFEFNLSNLKVQIGGTTRDSESMEEEVNFELEVLKVKSSDIGFSYSNLYTPENPTGDSDMLGYIFI